MEEESLKIVEMKKSRRKINKALLSKSFMMLFASGSAWCVCNEIHNFTEKGTLISIPYSLLMLYCFAEFLQWARKDTDYINDNLDAELDLEEEVEGLKK